MKNLGYYGKTVHRGDFVRFNLPQAFVTVWDDWWLDMLTTADERLGKRWPDTHDNAPRLHFSLADGIAGAGAWCGVVCMSRDKVGRRFPFCLTSQSEQTPLAALTMTLEAPLLRALDALCMTVNEPDFEFDALQSMLNELGEQLSDTPRHSDFTLQEIELGPMSEHGGDTVAVRVNQGSLFGTAQDGNVLVDAVLRQTAYQYSCWTHQGSEHLPPCTLIHSGMPTFENLLALLDGQWNTAHCSLLDVAMPPEPPGARTDDTAVTAIGTLPAAPPAPPAPPAPLTAVHCLPGVSTDLQEKNLSTEDLAALDDFSDGRIDAPKPHVPSVEPLELDDDEASEAPWEG